MPLPCPRAIPVPTKMVNKDTGGAGNRTLEKLAEELLVSIAHKPRSKILKDASQTNDG